MVAAKLRTLVLHKKFMERKKETGMEKEEKQLEKWEKPSVKELDINSTTLAGLTFTPISDGPLYS